jgi:hypothetical protein
MSANPKVDVTIFERKTNSRIESAKLSAETFARRSTVALPALAVPAPAVPTIAPSTPAVTDGDRYEFYRSETREEYATCFERATGAIEKLREKIAVASAATAKKKNRAGSIDPSKSTAVERTEGQISKIRDLLQKTRRRLLLKETLLTLLDARSLGGLSAYPSWSVFSDVIVYQLPVNVPLDDARAKKNVSPKSENENDRPDSVLVSPGDVEGKTEREVQKTSKVKSPTLPTALPTSISASRLERDPPGRAPSERGPAKCTGSTTATKNRSTIPKSTPERSKSTSLESRSLYSDDDDDDDEEEIESEDDEEDSSMDSFVVDDDEEIEYHHRRRPVEKKAAPPSGGKKGKSVAFETDDPTPSKNRRKNKIRDDLEIPDNRHYANRETVGKRVRTKTERLYVDPEVARNPKIPSYDTVRIPTQKLVRADRSNIKLAEPCEIDLCSKEEEEEEDEESAEELSIAEKDLCKLIEDYESYEEEDGDGDESISESDEDVERETDDEEDEDDDEEGEEHYVTISANILNSLKTREDEKYHKKETAAPVTTKKRNRGHCEGDSKKRSSTDESEERESKKRRQK